MKADAWFRAYTRAVDNAKLQTMDPALFRQLFNFWCLAKLNDGILPPTHEIAWRLRQSNEQVDADIKSLLAPPLRLLERHGKDISPTEWEEWQTRKPSSAERVQRYRDARKKVQETLDVTLPVTPNVTLPVTQNVTQRRGEERRIEETPHHKSTAPAPEFEPFDGPDPTQLVAAAVEACAQFWPNVGDKVDAIVAWQREAAGDASGVAEWCRKIVATARQHAPAQKAAKAADSHHFIPHLKRWVTRRDYTSPPPAVIRQQRGPVDLGDLDG